MGDLTEFLLARIAEDEADARAADGSRWLHQDKVVTFEALGPDGDYVDVSAPLSVDTRDNGWHIVNWSPTRVLAECEAKRCVIARCASVDYGMPSTHLAHGILAELALPYADHPDYRDEWRP